MPRFKFELLPNGLVRVDDRESGLVGLWHPNGARYCGDLTRSIVAPDIDYLVERGGF